jgi:DNA polymerase III subunit delta
MNVRPDQLAGVISNALYPVYMVSGDEPLQQMEALDLIRSNLREQDFCEREVLDVDAGFDWNRLLEETANLSLFASRRMIELRLPSAKPGRQGSQVLKDYLSQPVEDTVLIINAGKVDKSARQSAWFKAVDNSGIVIQCWPISLDRLPGWLDMRFRQRDMQADAEALSYISQHVEGNLLAADQEIEKLSLLLGPGKVTYQDVAQAIISQSRFSVVELVEALLEGAADRTVRIFNGLKAEDVAIQIVLWAVVKDLRLLVNVAGDPSSIDYTLKRSGVWQNRVPLFKRALARHRPQLFELLLRRCAHIDASSKGALISAEDPWNELESLCIRLAGQSRSRAR